MSPPAEPVLVGRRGPAPPFPRGTDCRWRRRSSRTVHRRVAPAQPHSTPHQPYRGSATARPERFPGLPGFLGRTADNVHYVKLDKRQRSPEERRILTPLSSDARSGTSPADDVRFRFRISSPRVSPDPRRGELGTAHTTDHPRRRRPPPRPALRASDAVPGSPGRPRTAVLALTPVRRHRGARSSARPGGWVCRARSGPLRLTSLELVLPAPGWLVLFKRFRRKGLDSGAAFQ